MAKRPRIAVVGSANIDLTTFTDRFPKPGETIFGQKFDLGFGGKGANQAVAARLCGAEVFMVARVGSDLFGPATIENFKKLGIDPTHVKQVEGVSSGVAPIFVEPNGQNRILVVKGANDALKPADVDAAADMLKIRRLHRAAVRDSARNRLLHRRFRAEARHSLHRESRPGAAGRYESLAGLDYFVPNESEAETITGYPGAQCRGREEMRRRSWRSGGIRRVIITLGSQRLAAGRPRRHASICPRSPSKASTAPAPATPSSAASPCFSAKAYPSAKQSGAPTCTPDSPPRASERRNPSTIVPASTRSGRRVPRTESVAELIVQISDIR